MRHTVVIQRAIFILSIFVFGIGFINQAGAASICSGAQFEDKDGLLVAEVESVVPNEGLGPGTSGWDLKTDFIGYTDQGYYQWIKSTNFSNPGRGLTEYTFKISKPGIYRFQWHSRRTTSVSGFDGNDAWIRVPEDYAILFAEENGDEYYPRNSGQLPQIRGSKGDGWVKIFIGALDSWTWQASTYDEEPKPVYARFDNPGVYTLQISGRSRGYAIDRWVMYHTSIPTSTATQLSQPETLCDDATPPGGFGIISTTPFDGSVNVEADTNLSVQFNRNIAKGSGNITIHQLSNDAVVETIDVNSAQVTIVDDTATIDPTFFLAYNADYYITIDAGAFTDLALEPFAGLTSSTAWNIEIQNGGTYTEKILPPAFETDADYRFGDAVAFDDDTAVIGAYGEDRDGRVNLGAAYMYTRSGLNDWTARHKLIAPNNQIWDEFGWAVELNNNVVAVSAWANPDEGVNKPGAVYIYERNGSTWIYKQTITANDAMANDLFGYTIMLQGNNLFIGAPGHNGNVGAAYLFKKNAGLWTQEQKLTPVDASAMKGFGTTLDFDVNSKRLLIGAPGDSSAQGAVYAYNLGGGTWQPTVKITAGDGAAGDQFGKSLSLEGNIAVIGAWQDQGGPSTGSAYVYSTTNGSDWAQDEKLLPDAAGDDGFGASVSLVGSVIVVSADVSSPGMDPVTGVTIPDGAGDESGVLYHFTDGGANWTQIQKITPADNEPGDLYGAQFDFNGTRAMVGTIGDDDVNTNSGAVYATDVIPLPTIENFYLYNIDSGTDARVLNDGDDIQINTLGYAWNFRAEPGTGTEIIRVQFRIRGDASINGAETNAPYHLPGDTEQLVLGPGSYTLEATAFNINNEPGPSALINLTLSEADFPIVLSTMPMDSATDVALDTALTVNFSEDVNLTGDWFNIECLPSNTTYTPADANVTGGPQNYLIDLDTNLPLSETCTVTLDADFITDTDGFLMDGDEDGLQGGDVTFSFTTVSPDIAVTGNGEPIASGDTTPAVLDNTDFGDVNVDSGTQENTFVIENTGTLDLDVTSITTVGANADEFTVTADTSNPVAANGGTLNFTVTFDPAAAGPRTASVNIASNDPDTPTYTFAVQGNGFTLTPDITVTGAGQTIASGDIAPEVADNTDFGSVGIASSTKENTFLVENPGGAPLTVTSIMTTGTNADEFTVTADTSNPVAANGGVLSFTVTFDPTAEGLRTATVEIVSDDPDTPTYTFAVQGNGVLFAPDLVLSGNGQTITGGDIDPEVADNTDFGGVDLVAGTEVRTFVITNEGNFDLNVTSITAGAPHAADFTVTADTSNPVAANGGTLNFTVTFDPTKIGLRGSLITINSDDPDTPTYEFGVSGIGLGEDILVQGNGADIPSGDTTPTLTDGTDFDTVLVDGDSNQNTFTIRNLGNVNLDVTSIITSGPNAGEFTVTADTSQPVAPDGTLNFAVTFDPTAEGLRTATVEIASSDPDTPTYTFAVQGTAQTQAITVQGGGATIANGDTTPIASDGTDFGDVEEVRGTAQNSFEIANLGSATLTVLGIRVTGANAGDFSVIADPADAVVGPGSSSTFSVTFAPSARGLRAATVEITSDDPNDATYTFAVQGNGVPRKGNLVRNGDFSEGERFYRFFGPVDKSVNGAVLNMTRSQFTGQAVVAQVLNQATFPAGVKFEATVDLSNASRSAKNLTLIVGDRNTYQSANGSLRCNFAVPASTQFQTYTLRGVVPAQWDNVAVGLFLADFNDPNLRVDNLRVVEDASLPVADVDCMEPSLLPNANLITNSAFQAGSRTYNFITPDAIRAEASAGVQLLTRSDVNSNVYMSQRTRFSTPANVPLEMTVQLGNSNNQPKSVALQLVDASSGSTLTCQLIVPGNTPLQPYTLRGVAVNAWNTLEMRLTVQDFNEQWLRVDNVDVRYRPGLSLTGTECDAPLVANRTLNLNGNLSYGNRFYSYTAGLANSVNNGAIAVTRTDTSSPQAITQALPFEVPAGSPLRANVSLGNTSANAKPVTLRLTGGSSSALQCEFVVPGNTPLQAYMLEGLAPANWNAINVQIVVEDFNEPNLRVDNVDVRYLPGAGITGLNCDSLLAAGRNLLVNGSFTNGEAAFDYTGSIDYTVSGGALNVSRTDVEDYAYVSQSIPVEAPAGAPFITRLSLGNPSATDKVVIARLWQAPDMSDEMICYFTVPANTPLQNYGMGGETGSNWEQIDFELIVLDEGTPSLLVDNLSVTYEPGRDINETRCVSPAGSGVTASATTVQPAQPVEDAAPVMESMQIEEVTEAETMIEIQTMETD